MPKTETVIAIATGVSNIALVILTAVYVWITRALLLQAKSSQEQNTVALQTQIHYATLPQLQLEAGIDQQNERWLSISNWSQNPAIDLDIWLLVPYSDVEREPFEYEIKRSSAQIWKCDSEGLFHIKDRLMCPLLPAKHRVVFHPDAPNSSDFKCFDQFRNVSGQNYCGLIWFRQSDRTPSKFVIGAVDPEVPLAFQRIEWGKEFSFPKLPFFSKDAEFRRYFLKSFDIAESWVHLTGKVRAGDVDDCGDIKKLDSSFGA
jgi:hypothetical protein